MALEVKRLTEELKKEIREKYEKNGYFISFGSINVFVDAEKDIMFIPGGGRGTQDEPCLLSMFYGDVFSYIVYEKRLSEQLVFYDVVEITEIPQDIEKKQVFKYISDYFKCHTDFINAGYVKNNPGAEIYRVEVEFSRCKVYGK